MFVIERILVRSLCFYLPCDDNQWWYWCSGSAFAHTHMQLQYFILISSLVFTTTQSQWLTTSLQKPFSSIVMIFSLAVFLMSLEIWSIFVSATRCSARLLSKIVLVRCCFSHPHAQSISHSHIPNDSTLIYRRTPVAIRRTLWKHARWNLCIAHRCSSSWSIVSFDCWLWWCNTWS